jgi:hypothetical protein
MNRLLLAGFLAISTLVVSTSHADDCDAKLTSEQRATFASLAPGDQQTLMKMKMRDGAPATCEFRAGLLDMLANDAPENRAKAFHYLLEHTLIRQPGAEAP